MSQYLIIGASSGIGKKLSQMLCENGHTVTGTYCRNKSESPNSLLTYHHLDVTDENITMDFLPDTLDGLVYCPGSINLKPFGRIKPEEFTADFNLQLTGAVKVIQTALPNLKKSAGPSVVLFSTVAVNTGLNFHTQVSVSKGAVQGLTVSLAAELAPKVRVNCIAPSLTDTPLAASFLNTEQKAEAGAQRHPLKRVGKAEDIAAMAEFLLSTKAGWITGQIIHVDGGMSTLKI
ncbi:MAG: SDR family oxidoreductase [Bacteroidetes bacterium]|nr:SDR family oxidoreductase [Bacteroidota bacterium]